MQSRTESHVSVFVFDNPSTRATLHVSAIAETIELFSPDL